MWLSPFMAHLWSCLVWACIGFGLLGMLINRLADEFDA